MPDPFHIVVCAGIVPDPLQTLEPVNGPNGPGVKNEMLLPAVLDPWAASALYEAARLAAKRPGSKVWLVSLGPKAKLQQVMMTVAQKAASNWCPSMDRSAAFQTRMRPLRRLPSRSPRSRTRSHEDCCSSAAGSRHARSGRHTADCWASGWASPTSFRAWTRSIVREDGSFEVLERVEGGKHQVSVCAGAPAVLGWATGNLASRATIRRSAWRTCAPSCQRCRRQSQ